ncbi:MAG: hypothetical protein IKE65_10520 [Clostridia bacterium]|nr:hypothetical protein [Clostridia bacterium]
MKKTLIALLLVLALSCSLYACSSDTKEDVKEYNSSADFAEFGISLEAPKGASNQKYGVVNSTVNGQDLTIAQITYTYNDTKCILRCAAAKDHNVSGYDENKAQNESQYPLNIEGVSSQIRIMQIEGKSIALCTLGDFSYSLCAETDDTVTITSCAMDAANTNVPASMQEDTTIAPSQASDESTSEQQTTTQSY